MTAESNRGESDIELSSDESRCLEDIESVLSPDKTTISNFIYSNDLWTTPSLSSTANSTLTNSTNNHDDDRHEQQQMITLKPVSTEPLSPSPALIHDGEMCKTVATIHRRPMLIAFTDPRASSPTGPTHFKCTQCHETFDSLLLGQEHANNGTCTSDAAVNVCRFVFIFKNIHVLLLPIIEFYSSLNINTNFHILCLLTRESFEMTHPVLNRSRRG
jgi:hypothetical protein